ncbi:trypsin-like peptidase domain-containing protein [Brevibacillus humidisoli]|uniref:S1C family serine protease n=1 Tax=Brevibacillus humidisoli TaxID=2895522 RepID=UPI001E4F47F3|nr:trypsin-like peptidase domain-containing protein [Brevibacillus humidisoli]UFJ39332.1 trypsin-like peptidase domain-containing protein [Brevibacillus humidisoli]
MKRKKWASVVHHKYPAKSSLHPYNFFVPLVDQVKDSVVSIVTEGSSIPSDLKQFINQLLDSQPLNDSMKERSFGTGFIFHPQGYILTSEHVINKSKNVLVKLWNGRVYQAQPVVSDSNRDYAILKIDADRKLRALPLGSSRTTQVGEWVIGIGSPLGLENSVTAGIISAKNRRLHVAKRVYEEVLQTDAAINPGNSGGPLINLHGEVVGMNAFIIQSSQCLGFAIGIDALKPYLRDFY